MMWEAIKDWYLNLGAEYGVNPLIFGAIYIGAIPLFIASIGWLARRRKAGRSIVLPTMSAGFCFVSAYLYLAIAGRNIPTWVWIFIAALLAYGVWSTIRDLKRKAAEDAGESGLAKVEK